MKCTRKSIAVLTSLVMALSMLAVLTPSVSFADEPPEIDSWDELRSGKITVKKGLAKGTYKLKVRITAAGGRSYASGTKDVTVKIKVK